MYISYLLGKVHIHVYMCAYIYRCLFIKVKTAIIFINFYLMQDLVSVLFKYNYLYSDLLFAKLLPGSSGATRVISALTLFQEEFLKLRSEVNSSA